MHQNPSRNLNIPISTSATPCNSPNPPLSGPPMYPPYPQIPKCQVPTCQACMPPPLQYQRPQCPMAQATPPCALNSMNSMNGMNGMKCPSTLQFDSESDWSNLPPRPFYPNHSNFFDEEDIMDDDFDPGSGSDSDSENISDSQLLSFLLRKYSLDKTKLIASLRRTREKRIRNSILEDFYKYRDQYDHPSYRERPIDEHYTVFKKWNRSDVKITKSELEDYFLDHHKNRDQSGSD